MSLRTSSVMGPAICLVICYSLVSVFTSMLAGWVATPNFKFCLLAAVFGGAALAAALVGAFHPKHGSPAPSFSRDRREIVTIVVGGLLGAGYFWNLFVTSAAAADWFEKALLPVAMTLAAWRWDRERPTKTYAIGLVVGLFGYAVIMWALEWNVEAVVLSLTGAIGSVMAIRGMRRLARKPASTGDDKKVSRFWAFAWRYGVVALGCAVIAFIRPPAEFTTRMFGVATAGVIVGALLINATLYSALELMDRGRDRASLLLSAALMLVPVASTAFQFAFIALGLYVVPIDLSVWGWTGAIIIGVGSLLSFWAEAKPTGESPADALHSSQEALRSERFEPVIFVPETPSTAVTQNLKS